VLVFYWRSRKLRGKGGGLFLLPAECSAHSLSWSGHANLIALASRMVDSLHMRVPCPRRVSDSHFGATSVKLHHAIKRPTGRPVQVMLICKTHRPTDVGTRSRAVRACGAFVFQPMSIRPGTCTSSRLGPLCFLVCSNAACARCPMYNDLSASYCRTISFFPTIVDGAGCLCIMSSGNGLVKAKQWECFYCRSRFAAQGTRSNCMARMHPLHSRLLPPAGVNIFGEPVVANTLAAAPVPGGSTAATLAGELQQTTSLDVALASTPSPVGRLSAAARGSSPARRTRHVFSGSTSAKLRAYYERKPEAGLTTPCVPLSCADIPSKFNCGALTGLLRFALSAGGSGLSMAHQQQFSKVVLDVEMAATGGRLGVVGTAFPTPSAFLSAVPEEQSRCLAKRMWEQTPIRINGVTYMFYSRDLWLVAKELLLKADDIQLTGEALPAGPDGTRMRSESMDSNDFLREEVNVRRLHPGAFMLGVQLYLDEALVSWSGAHYIFPIRARVVHVKDDGGMWVTVGYLSHVPEPVGQTEADRLTASDARNDLLQRSLAILLRQFNRVSQHGEQVQLSGNKSAMAVSRLVGLMMDQPQERSLMSLMGNGCQLPCSFCCVHRDKAGVATAGQAKPRDVIAIVEAQLAAAELRDRDPRVSLRSSLKREHSSLAFVLAVAAVHGLTTGDLMLYKIVSFDLLHVWKLGIPRLLGERFPDFMVSVCHGYVGGQVGSRATPDILNKRGWEIGRRCVPAPTPPGYVSFRCISACLFSARNGTMEWMSLPQLSTARTRNRAVRKLTHPSPSVLSHVLASYFFHATGLPLHVVIAIPDIQMLCTEHRQADSDNRPAMATRFTAMASHYGGFGYSISTFTTCSAWIPRANQR